MAPLLLLHSSGGSGSISESVWYLHPAICFGLPVVSRELGDDCLWSASIGSPSALECFCRRTVLFVLASGRRPVIATPSRCRGHRHDSAGESCSCRCASASR